MYSVFVCTHRTVAEVPYLWVCRGGAAASPSVIIGSLPKPDALRYRCHTILSLQRIVAHLHATAAAEMPPQAQLQLLMVLQVRPLDMPVAVCVPVMPVDVRGCVACYCLCKHGMCFMRWVGQSAPHCGAGCKPKSHPEGYACGNPTELPEALTTFGQSSAVAVAVVLQTTKHAAKVAGRLCFLSVVLGSLSIPQLLPKAVLKLRS